MKMDATLTQTLKNATDRDELPVIITFARQEDVPSALRKTGIRPQLQYESIPAIAAALSPAKIREAAALPEVQRIELDTEARALHKP